jgi:ferrochelatase
VRRYLAEFLMDGRVIDIPAPLRWLLVHGVILRTRPRKSAAAYRAIWTERGSPLLLHSEALAEGLRQELGDGVPVAIGMRYGEPSLQRALDQLAAAVDEIVVVPLFPQYSAAAWATVFDAVAQWARHKPALPSLQLLPPFHAHPGFLDAVAAVAKPHLDAFRPDRVLMSFHGLPESHVRASDRSGGAHCLSKPDCCGSLGAANAFCYRAQCFATARALAARLELPADRHEVAFQSRLTRAWIQPFTDQRVEALAKQGVGKLAVLCPAFVADCLETLEEIGLRAREAFVAAGGKELRLVPCVNSDPAWVRGLALIVRERLRD